MAVSLHGEIEAARAEAHEDLRQVRVAMRWLFGIVIMLLIAFFSFYLARSGI